MVSKVQNDCRDIFIKELHKTHILLPFMNNVFFFSDGVKTNTLFLLSTLNIQHKLFHDKSMVPQGVCQQLRGSLLGIYL